MNRQEILNTSIWWSKDFPAFGPTFSRPRATQLHSAGLKKIKDVWNENTKDFYTWDRMIEMYGLEAREATGWQRLLENIPSQ